MPELYSLHPNTFQYHKPTDKQFAQMDRARAAITTLAAELDNILLSSSDKTYVLRKLREIGMWANVAITRHPDGTPRDEGGEV